MQRTSFLAMQCPIARSLERVGDWWSILILRDAFHGLRRFDEFHKSLGIAPNILARRLKHLTEAGLFERRQYSVRPPRHDYALTALGQDFFPVIAALLAWGNRNFATEGVAVRLADRASGRPVEPVVVDARTMAVLRAGETMIQAGAVALPAVRARAEHMRSAGGRD